MEAGNNAVKPKNSASKLSGQESLLERVLEVMRLLEQHRAASQEELTRLSGVPKSSLRRILLDMLKNGLLSRDDNGLFSLRMRLMAVAGGSLQVLPGALRSLAQEGQGTAEWYESRSEGMVLVSRCLQRGCESGVVAREGFVRSWGEELDAVAQLGEAFFRKPQEREDEHYLQYTTDGIRSEITQEEVESDIAQAVLRGWACDRVYNANNVKRYAAVVFENEIALGVISLAVVARPAQLNSRDEEYMQAVKDTLQKFFPDSLRLQ